MPILIKDKGVWKDTSDVDIKVNGVWKTADKVLIKNGGTWADTSNLSATKLDYDMTIAKDTDGSRYLVEKNDPSHHKATLYSGWSLGLKSKENVSIPINATLSANILDTLIITSNSGKTTMVDNGDDTYTLTMLAGASKLDTLRFVAPIGSDHLNEPVKITFDAHIISGSWTSDSMSLDGNALTKVSYTIVEGTNTFPSGGYMAKAREYAAYPLAGQECVITFSNVKMELITAVHGSVTVFNMRTHSFEDQTLLPSTAYPLTNGIYGSICKLHTNKFTQADLTAMNARPELLIEWYLGTKTLPSGIVKGANDKVYYNLKEMGGTEVLTAPANSQSSTSEVGIQNLLLKIDSNGIPTGMAKAGTIEGDSTMAGVKLPMVDPAKQMHMVNKCLTRIHGDITQVVDVECTP